MLGSSFPFHLSSSRSFVCRIAWMRLREGARPKLIPELKRIIRDPPRGRNDRPRWLMRAAINNRDFTSPTVSFVSSSPDIQLYYISYTNTLIYIPSLYLFIYLPLWTSVTPEIHHTKCIFLSSRQNAISLRGFFIFFKS